MKYKNKLSLFAISILLLGIGGLYAPTAVEYKPFGAQQMVFNVDNLKVNQPVNFKGYVFSVTFTKENYLKTYAREKGVAIPETTNACTALVYFNPNGNIQQGAGRTTTYRYLNASVTNASVCNEMRNTITNNIDKSYTFTGRVTNFIEQPVTINSGSVTVDVNAPATFKLDSIREIAIPKVKGIDRTIDRTFNIR